jgi:integrase
MIVTPAKAPGKNFFRVSFRNPFQNGRVITGSLGTDEQIAKRDAHNIGELCSDPDAWQDQSNPLLPVKFSRRALELVFGKDAPVLKRIPKAMPLLPEELVELAGRIIGTLDSDLSKKFDHFDVVKQMINEFQSVKVEELLKRLESAEAELKVLRSEKDVLHEKLEGYFKKENQHVKVLIGEAFDEFKKVYPQDHAPRTVAEVEKAVQAFVDSLQNGRNFKLGLVDASHVSEWLEKMRAEDGTALKALTRQHRKTYLSAFLTWAQQRYRLAVHPVQHSVTLKGASRSPEVIEAMRLSEIQALLAELKSASYWQAWPAFAILAGTRWHEQACLTLDSANLEDNIIVVRSAKTGRQRRIPIEQTTLRPILESHLRRRVEERKKPKATDAEASEWLFPSIVPGNPYKPRVLAPVGQWSHSRVWHDAWERLVPKDKDGKPQFSGVWHYGPREWRHSFGTALGHAGMTALEISNLMGNSAAVAQRHYVETSEHGKRWPFKW